MTNIFEIVGYAVVFIYSFALIVVTVYCIVQFHLLYHYLGKHSNKVPSKFHENDLETSHPFVTVQLPIYNEKFVVERLIDNIVKLDYPKDRFEIHVLDDSTDETKDIVKNKVEYYSNQGINITQITRSNRSGYKAGALKDGMPKAQGEFIAIFDADFLPRIDFLKKTLPFFSNDKVGVVQTRWGHINKDYSLLTQVQAFQLDVHFTVEQLGRKNGNYLLQFNGTAGIWRRICIEEAGGWQADTLTEDLDLSYRAQLIGWEIEYLEHIISPAELPAEMNGLKSQQYRWMKGGAETAVKVLPEVWNSKIGFYKKFYASAHLLSSSVFLFVFLLGVFSVPLIFFLEPLNIDKDIFGIFIIGLISIIGVYYVANVENSWKGNNKLKLIFKFTCLFPIFLALSMGLSLHNALAVVSGLRGKTSPFVRTPKFNVGALTSSLNNKSYITSSLNKITIAEGILAIYFGFGLVYGIRGGDWAFAVMHLLLSLGYGMIFFYSFLHARMKS